MASRISSAVLLATLAPLLLPLGAEARPRGLSDDVAIDILSEGGRIHAQYPLAERSDATTERAYIEAIPGAQYSIRVRNRGNHRVGVVIAVDGRNIISGDRSNLKEQERMYVLDPHSEAVYEGWRTGRNRVNRFYFTDAGDSYAGAFGDHSAMGVIAIAVYPEKARPRERPQSGESSTRYGPLSAAPGARSQPGTGFGDERYSPSVRVAFEPQHRPSQRVLLKYEWRKTLCRMGIISCGRHNRLWDDDTSRPHERSSDYAPYPPRR